MEFVKLSNYAASRGLKTSTIRKQLPDLSNKAKARSGGLWYVQPDAFDRMRMQRIKAKKDSKRPGLLESSLPLAIEINKAIGKDSFAALKKRYGRDTGTRTPSHALIAKRIIELRGQGDSPKVITEKIISEVQEAQQSLS